MADPSIPWWRTSFGEEEIREIGDAIRAEHISQGPLTVQFETQFAAALDVPYAVATTSGSIALSGEDVKGWPVAKILEGGVSYITEDPISMAMVGDMRVDENLVLGELAEYGNGGVWLDLGSIRGRKST